MKHKWIRGYLLIAIFFPIVGFMFSCKGVNNKEEVVITFAASPIDKGIVSATVDGVPIKSGVTKVEKGKEVIFTLKIISPSIYTIDGWEGEGVVVSNNPLVAKLTVSKDVTVTAKIREIGYNLVLSSLKIHNKVVDISNLDNLNVKVENFFDTIVPENVVAMFTTEVQETPEKFEVIVDKTVLSVGENTVKLTVPCVAGKNEVWEKEVKITRMDLDVPNEIPSEVKLEAIEVAIISEKSGNGKIEAFKPLKDFESGKSGPYETEQAKTAYIALKMKIAKPSNGDFSIEVSNKTTYIKPVIFSRSTEGDSNYFVKNSQDILDFVTLSKGLNILEVKVKNPDSSKTGVYTIMIHYDGGPDPLEKELDKRKIIPGIYCPAQRKPLEGENPDFVWMICIAGWWPHCKDALRSAGSKGGNIADKYKNKGLRTISIDIDGTQQIESEKKWKNAGANFPLYTRQACCFYPLYKDVKNYPYNGAVKEWQVTKIYASEELVKNAFGF